MLDYQKHQRHNNKKIDEFKTCASLSDREESDARFSLWKENVAFLTTVKIDQLLEEHELKIDNLVDMTLKFLPKNIMDLKVCDFVKKFPNSTLTDFSNVCMRDEQQGERKRRKKELVGEREERKAERDSGESTRRKVRQQMSSSQTLELPSTGEFYAMDDERKRIIFSVLCSVTQVYNEILREESNSL